MLYLENTTEAQGLLIPKDGQTVSDTLIFQAVSTIDQKPAFGNFPVSDLGTSDQYFTIAVELLEGVPDGEYEYTLKDGLGGPVLSSGMLYVGDLPSVTRRIYSKTIQYEQYEN